MPPETRSEFIALRQLVCNARSYRKLASARLQLGQIDNAAVYIGEAIAIERRILEQVDALEARGTLIAIEALVASATSYARERRDA
ncbi:hypothetical protein KUW09_24915 [Mameliella alba]|nr:hypothetical protein [Antarctobacter heliothermus]MBY6147311.1 hypothetical protein [Mameliella alba]MCA0957367.1 hypothetical protein [Mameliella alba]